MRWVKLQPPGSPGEARRSDGDRVNQATNHDGGCLRLTVPAQAEQRAGAPTRRHHVPQSSFPSGARVTGSSDSLWRPSRRHRARAAVRAVRAVGAAERQRGRARETRARRRPGARGSGVPRLREGAARRLTLPGAQAAVPAFSRRERRPRRSGTGAGGGGGGGYPIGPPPGLYLTQAHFAKTFEGWLKGAPEFEVHVLGQSGQTDSLKDYQCAGERQSWPYYFDQNNLDWTGSVLLFSRTQLDNYHAAHLNQDLRAFAVEDDDTACQIKTDNDVFKRLEEAVDGANRALTAGKDTTSSTAARIWKFAQALQKLFTAIASLINTNDELVGNAVQDSITGEYHAGFNRIVKGE